MDETTEARRESALREARNITDYLLSHEDDRAHKAAGALLGIMDLLWASRRGERMTARNKAGAA